jgi:SAM-dependent methyltransferase
MYNAGYIYMNNVEDIVKEVLLKYYKKREKLKILDVGCGNKPYKRIIENYCQVEEYIGIDYYNAKYADIELDLNKEKIPFPDDYFDLILCTDVLEHLYNPIFVINEMRRVVKNNGFLIISTPFLFPIHDKNYDYFRYTDLFYKRLFDEFGDEIILIKKSNSLFSFPLLIFANFLGGLILPKSPIYPIFWVFIRILDKLSNKLLKNIFANSSYYIHIVLAIKIRK